MRYIERTGTSTVAKRAGITLTTTSTEFTSNNDAKATAGD